MYQLLSKLILSILYLGKFMNLHEYQSKILFNEFGIPVPVGFTINDSSKAISVAKKIGGNAWVVKAQIHAGARGKAGAVKLVNSEQELIETSQYLLGNNIATPQTHGKKLPVNTLLIEQTLNIKKEYYLGILIDRKTECITFMASTEGGMNIEDVALNTPDKIVTINVHPSSSLQAFQCRQIAFALNLEGKQINQLTKIMMGLYKLFCSKDLSLIEINPLIIDSEDQLLALDAKVSVDDNALYRLPDILNLRDTSQEDEKENEAATHQLNYITLDGNIGNNVNPESNSSSQIVGDVDIRVKLTPNGKIQFKAFNHSNNDLIYETAPYTQGIGLSFKEEYNTVKELMQKIGSLFKKKEKRTI